MNKLTSLLTMTGMGALAAVAIGAGPAEAAGTTASPVAKPAAPQVQQHHGWDRTTVGYYRSGRSCELAGRIGERFGRWYDHDCNFVRFGFHRGQWELEVSSNRFGHGHGFGDHGFGDHGFGDHGIGDQGRPHNGGWDNDRRDDFPRQTAR